MLAYFKIFTTTNVLRVAESESGIGLVYLTLVLRQIAKMCLNCHFLHIIVNTDPKMVAYFKISTILNVLRVTDSDYVIGLFNLFLLFCQISKMCPKFFFIHTTS